MRMARGPAGRAMVSRDVRRGREPVDGRSAAGYRGGMTIPLRYRERPPPAHLRPWVECTWTLAGDAEAGTLRRVLPDGCMDVLFVLEGSPTLPRNASGADALVVGTQLATLEVAHEGRVALLGVRFRPGALPSFVPLHAGDVVDAGAPLSDVAPSDWGALARQLPQVEAGERPRLVENLLEARLARRAVDGSSDLARIGASLLAGPDAPGGSSELADRLGVGRRTLERRFRAAVGVGPATLARLLRFRAAARALGSPREGSISAVAHACGYADHPHLSREFRSLAGMSPSAFRRRALPGARTDPAETVAHGAGSPRRLAGGSA